MTQKTKLEILGPYTPEHEGPFCTRDGKPVELKFRDGRGKWTVGGYISDLLSVTLWRSNGLYVDGVVEHGHDLMNAREVPVAREFWVNEYTYGVSGRLHFTEESAVEWGVGAEFTRTIHVREVMPGDEA